MYYFIIALSALVFSVQFMFNDIFQKENGTGLRQVLNFSLYTSVFGLALLIVINGFKVKISFFSVVTAILYSLVLIALNYSSIKALEYANLSIYSVFSMIGGMVLPFLYGVFCGEEITLLKVLCGALIIVSILMTITDRTQSKKALKYYIAVFFLNGMVGVISSFHQSFEAFCVDSTSFLILTRIITMLLCLAAMIPLWGKGFVINSKSVLFCFGSGALNSIANLMLLVALLHIPTSVQYPIVTGGTIVFSTMIDKMKKINVSKWQLLASAIALASSVFMAF